MFIYKIQNKNYSKILLTNQWINFLKPWALLKALSGPLFAFNTFMRLKGSRQTKVIFDCHMSHFIYACSYSNISQIGYFKRLILFFIYAWDVLRICESLDSNCISQVCGLFALKAHSELYWGWGKVAVNYRTQELPVADPNLQGAETDGGFVE